MFLDGAFDWLADTAGDISEGLMDAGQWVSEEVSSVLDGTEAFIDSAYDKSAGVVNEVWSSGKGIVVWAGDRIEQAETAGTDLVDTGGRIAEHSVAELGIWGEKAIDEGTGMISTPLMLLAGGLGLALVFAGRNSTVSASYAR